MSLEKYIQDYQLEKIFPRHYFDKLQVRELVAGDAICHQGEALTALSYFAKGKLCQNQHNYLKKHKRSFLVE